MKAMDDLPLFPLDTVLFPGMPLALHIFEDRYKLMIGMCLEKRQPFGVVLIKEGTEALGPLATTYLVGCTARITQVERLGQGRMNIGAVGRRRFRILSYNRDLPYLIGNVADYPLQTEPTEIRSAAKKLRPWVVRYMNELTRIEGSEYDHQRIPDDPTSFAYMAGALLRIPPEQKQPLLASVTASELVESLHKHYRREVAFLKNMFDQTVTDQGPFSMN